MTPKTKFEIYGGQFVSETLMSAIGELATGAPGAGNGNPVVMRFEA